MAITLISKPSDFGRVWDTNRLTYCFSSNNYTQPNFQFYFSLIYWSWDGTQNNIGNYLVYPNSGGTVTFNPSQIYRNYLSYDFNCSITGLTECVNSSGRFSLSCYEYYGAPPAKLTDGSQWTGEVSSYPPMRFYNGCQMNIPFDYNPLNAKGNALWVMSGATSGQFLTSATEFRGDADDLMFLYFLDDLNGRPTRIRYTVYYNCYGGGLPAAPNTLGVGNQISNTPLYTQDAVVGTNIILDSPLAVIPPSWSGICSTVVYDTNVSYSNYGFMHTIPCGPYQVAKTALSGLSSTWLYYTIDLMSGSTVLNKSPFYIWRNEKCDRFGGKWQLHWLNPQGGWDNYTFDRKFLNTTKIAKSTYKIKLPSDSSFNTYYSGERVFDTQITEEITLRSNLLTQKEAQLLTQLVQSPRVYVSYKYTYSGTTTVYGVPYIITTDEWNYPSKVNDKEVNVEIKLRAANDKIIQRD